MWDFRNNQSTRSLLLPVHSPYPPLNWGKSFSDAKMIQLSPSRRPVTLLTIDPSPAPQVSSAEGNPPTNLMTDADTHAPTPFAITSVAWAPSCGRSYHLIATGGRDGQVRIWRVKPPADEPERESGQEDGAEGEDGKWKASIVADFDHHKLVVFIYLLVRG